MRTEDQKLRMAPIEVTLGTAKYQIPVLSMNPSRVWREQLVKLCGSILSEFNKDVQPKTMLNGLTAALVHFPEKVADLLFAYCPSLPKDIITADVDGATEEQIAIAFTQVMGVAYPFLPQLGMVIQAARSQFQSE